MPVHWIKPSNWIFLSILIVLIFISITNLVHRDCNSKEKAYSLKEDTGRIIQSKLSESKSANNLEGGESKSIEKIVGGILDEDLVASVFWDVDNRYTLRNLILEEKRQGLRDQYFLPTSYITRLNNTHFDDVPYQHGIFQQEVYLLAREILRRMSKQQNNPDKKLTVIDVGCGAGWKLVHYLAKEFKTIGVETEPAISFLRKTYPDLTWVDSGKVEESLPETADLGNCDLGISADVIEHIREPKNLIDYLKKLHCTSYIISTPKREMCNHTGPPINTNHVREWTFTEMQLYLESEGFVIIKSFNGIASTYCGQHVGYFN